MSDKKAKPEGRNAAGLARRRLLAALAATSGAAGASYLPKRWTQPVVDAVVVPLHAQASGCISCNLSIFVAVATGANNIVASGPPAPVGPEGSFDISVCIGADTTAVQMVPTNNQAFGNGFEFDESMTISVTRPDSSVEEQAFTSYEECVPATAVAVDSTTPIDISSLFQDGSGAFICGIHDVEGSQCNSDGTWAIRSFDIVVSS